MDNQNLLVKENKLTHLDGNSLTLRPGTSVEDAIKSWETKHGGTTIQISNNEGKLLKFSDKLLNNQTYVCINGDTEYQDKWHNYLNNKQIREKANKWLYPKEGTRTSQVGRAALVIALTAGIGAAVATSGFSIPFAIAVAGIMFSAGSVYSLYCSEYTEGCSETYKKQNPRSATFHNTAGCFAKGVGIVGGKLLEIGCLCIIGAG